MDEPLVADLRRLQLYTVGDPAEGAGRVAEARRPAAGQSRAGRRGAALRGSGALRRAHGGAPRRSTSSDGRGQRHVGGSPSEHGCRQQSGANSVAVQAVMCNCSCYVLSLLRFREDAVSYGVRLRVSGDYACFTRPEMKVERVSYDVITPSAARGILEAVHWKPAIRWTVDRIHVLAAHPLPVVPPQRGRRQGQRRQGPRRHEGRHARRARPVDRGRPPAARLDAAARRRLRDRGAFRADGARRGRRHARQARFHVQSKGRRGPVLPPALPRHARVPGRLRAAARGRGPARIPPRLRPARPRPRLDAARHRFRGGQHVALLPRPDGGRRRST